MIHRFGGDLKRYDDYLTPLKNHIILKSDATLPIFPRGWIDQKYCFKYK